MLAADRRNVVSGLTALASIGLIDTVCPPSTKGDDYARPTQVVRGPHSGRDAHGPTTSSKAGRR